MVRVCGGELLLPRPLPLRTLPVLFVTRRSPGERLVTYRTGRVLSGEGLGKENVLLE